MDDKPQKKYRVWTKNSFRRPAPDTDWMTYAEAHNYIISKWHHWPPWAFISKASNAKTFTRYNGE